MAGLRPPGQDQAVNQSKTNRQQLQRLASSNGPESAASSTQNQIRADSPYEVHDPNILYRELHQKYPNYLWFNSYASLKKLGDNHSSLQRLRESADKKKHIEKVLLADLPIREKGKDGDKSFVRLQRAVQNEISNLLVAEARSNPVTLISSQPEMLWSGNLWLGGIKDSVNESWLMKNDISAVVTIHPEDWLAASRWKALFKRWNKNDVLPQLGSKGARWQYLIDLMDDSSSNLVAEFGTAFGFMNHFLLDGKNVLVHCKMGQSRSASLVLGYMLARYYKRCIANRPSAEQQPLQVFNELKRELGQFTKEISEKRRGVSTKKFKDQLEQYLARLARYKGPEGQPFQQSKPKSEGKKGGGGIIQDAVIVLCYMHDLTPTGEILGYWHARKDTNIHYWADASGRKAGNEGISGFFTRYMK
ncbi:hypothetical protein Daus18300_006591 [Diaporthe australafricana]|uniref:Tyrosine specific protein phosphatases domain-containing protein n=1 Tax=Diaporthe australafricana TaxID=127596 RepID=A0ABR3WTI7_9PEZI